MRLLSHGATDLTDENYRNPSSVTSVTLCEKIRTHFIAHAGKQGGASSKEENFGNEGPVYVPCVVLRFGRQVILQGLNFQVELLGVGWRALSLDALRPAGGHTRVGTTATAAMLSENTPGFGQGVAAGAEGGDLNLGRTHGGGVVDYGCRVC